MNNDNYFLSGINIQDSCANLSAGDCAKQSLMKRGVVTAHMLDVLKSKQQKNASNKVINKIGILEVDLNSGKLIASKNRFIKLLNGYYVPVNTNNIVQINQNIMNKITDINFVSRVAFTNIKQAKDYAAKLMNDGGGMNDAVQNVIYRKEDNNKMLLINNTIEDINGVENALYKEGIYILDRKDIHFNHKKRFIRIINYEIISKYEKTRSPSKLFFVVFNVNKNIKVNSMGKNNMGLKEGFTGSNDSSDEGTNINAPSKPETGYDNGPGWENDEGWLCLDKDSGTAGVPMRIDEYGLVQGMTGTGDNKDKYKFGACSQSTIPKDREKIGLICGDSSWNNNTEQSNKGWTEERNARTVKKVFGYGQEWAEKPGSMCDVAKKQLPLMELNTPQPAAVPNEPKEQTVQPSPQAVALASSIQNMKVPNHIDTTKDKEMIKNLLTSIDDDVNVTKKINKQHTKFLRLQKDQLKLMRDAVAKKKQQLRELKEDSYTNQTLTRYEEYKMKRTLAQKKIVTMLIIGVTTCMVLVILQRYTPLYYIVPDIVFSSLFSIVTVITIYYLGKSIIDFSQRSTKNFDEYNWHGLNDISVDSYGYTSGGGGFDISVFDNIGNSDEITLKFSGTDSNMIDSEVKKLRNSKDIISDLSMIGNNINVEIVTSDMEDIEDSEDTEYNEDTKNNEYNEDNEEEISDVKDDFIKDLDVVRTRMRE